ncbi:MAG: hypothetical protein JWQ54_4992 [Mucilaginibacter sp.]|nr:hypothetical protein [Mucilaginibacter sp.]
MEEQGVRLMIRALCALASSPLPGITFHRSYDVSPVFFQVEDFVLLF